MKETHKLSFSQQLEIYKEWNKGKGKSWKELAKTHGVTYNAVKYICEKLIPKMGKKMREMIKI